MVRASRCEPTNRLYLDQEVAGVWRPLVNYEVSLEPRRGSIRTRVPPSSIDRSALDVLTMRFDSLGDDADRAIGEQVLSSDYTALNAAPPLAARMAAKSRSFVMTTNWCSFSHARISTSGRCSQAPQSSVGRLGAGCRCGSETHCAHFLGAMTTRKLNRRHRCF